MKKYTYLITSFLIAIVASNLHADLNQFAKQYTVLKKFDSRRIYHMNSATRLGDGWSCGYFCLWNAKELERRLGLGRNDWNNFKARCLGYLSPHGKNPYGGSSNEDLIYMADDYVSVHSLYPLMLHDGMLLPMIGYETTSWTLSSRFNAIHVDVAIGRHEVNIKIKAPYKTAESAIKAAAQQEKVKRLRLYMRDIKNKVLSDYGLPHVAHFVCGFSGHWILVSAVKLPGEQPALFVFDNLNKKIIPGSSAMKFIDQLYSLFTS